jgi:hypothetical protein
LFCHSLFSTCDKSNSHTQKKLLIFSVNLFALSAACIQKIFFDILVFNHIQAAHNHTNHFGVGIIGTAIKALSTNLNALSAIQLVTSVALNDILINDQTINNVSNVIIKYQNIHQTSSIKLFFKYHSIVINGFSFTHKLLSSLHIHIAFLTSSFESSPLNADCKVNKNIKEIDNAITTNTG